MKRILILMSTIFFITGLVCAQDTELQEQITIPSARARKRLEKEQRVSVVRPQYACPPKHVNDKKTFVPDTRRLETGREYYDSLIKEASKRHWAIPISFNFSFADSGYDCNGCKTNLAATVFGKNNIRIQDVYLFSKLSIENKVRINNCDALQPNRGAIPIPGPGVTGGIQFGAFSDDLYTTLLAPVELLFDIEQKEFTLVPSFVFHYDFGKYDQYAFSGGLNVPIKTRTHEIVMGCKGGELFKGAFLPDTVGSQNTATQFFRDFTDVNDFIQREIFEKKGIIFEPCQRKTGFGDMSLFVAFEYHSNPLIELGFALVFPTASSNKNNRLWEPALGSESFQFNPFIQFIFSTSSCYLNPFIRIAGEVSRSFSSSDLRVPRLVTNPSRRQVQNVPGLDHPSFFDQYYVDSFSEFDSCTPLISDKACIKQKTGTKIILGIGNYAFNVFHEDFRFGIYYDYMHKSKDNFEPGDCDCCCGPNPSVDLCLTCTQIDMKTLEECSDQHAHIISSSLTYKFKNLFELGFGGQFVIHGKNVASTKSLYFNFVVVF